MMISWWVCESCVSCGGNERLKRSVYMGLILVYIWRGFEWGLMRVWREMVNIWFTWVGSRGCKASFFVGGGVYGRVRCDWKLGGLRRFWRGWMKENVRDGIEEWWLGWIVLCVRGCGREFEGMMRICGSSRNEQQKFAKWTRGWTKGWTKGWTSSVSKV